MASQVTIWLVLAAAPVLATHDGVIVHLFEWKYSDIAQECEEFLAPRGFKGIQIPPPSENVIISGRPWYERYQPVSYMLTTRSGNMEELADMLQRCNRVGVRVYADIVINHMTAATDKCRGTGGSQCGLYTYPGVPYISQHFHHPTCTIHNYANTTEVRDCELVGLHDLDQSQAYVQQKIVNYINNLIELGVAGIRVDAAKHMSPKYLAVIYSRLNKLNTKKGFLANTKPFIFQEVISEPVGVNYQEYTSMGLVTDFQYGRELGRCFQGRNYLKWLKNFGLAWNLIPGDQSIVFIENHDTEREGHPDVINYKTSRSYKMAISFMLAWPYGSPKILSSYKFSSITEGPPEDADERIVGRQPIIGNECSNGWLCQHRWRQIYNMVTFRNVVEGTEVESWWDNGKNQIAFCRGNKGFIVFNLENYPLTEKLQTCLAKGSYCDIISGDYINNKCTGRTVVVGEDGMAQILVGKFDQNSPDDGVLAIHVMAKFL